MTETTVTTREEQEGGRLAGVRAFLSATRAELKKVSWPTREELMKASRMILVLSVMLGITIGLLDFALQKILVDGVAAIAR